MCDVALTTSPHNFKGIFTCIICARTRSIIVRLNRSARPLCCGVFASPCSRMIPCVAAKARKHDERYSPPLSDLRIHNFWHVFLSAQARYIRKQSNTSDFFDIKNTRLNLVASSMKVKKYFLPEHVGDCIGPKNICMYSKQYAG